MGDVAKPARTDYRPPTVRVYGDAKKVTEATGNKGLSDGGKEPRHKTH